METLRSEYRAVSTASNWIDQLSTISGKDFLQLFAGQDINLLNIHQWKILGHSIELDQGDARSLLMYNLLATDTLTMPVSIVAVLEDSPGSLVSKLTLSVHLIGADAKEYLNLMMFEEILHLLPPSSISR